MHSQFKWYHFHLSVVHADFQDTKGFLTHVLTYTKTKAPREILRNLSS